MKNLLILVAMLIYGCGNNAPKSQQEASKDSAHAMAESMDDIDDSAVNFATDAAADNLKEIELGKLALKNADLQRLKDFGKKMIDAHIRSNTELQRACYSAGVTLPAGMNKKDHDEVNEMAQKKRADFDKAYAKKMVKEHQHMMEKLNAAANNMKDTALQNYAKNTLPVVNAHLDEAQNILTEVRKSYRWEQHDDMDNR